MKRYIFPFILILSMLFSLSGVTHPVQAVNLSSSPDLDQDGITNAMETSGWYNLAGGPYITDPNMADSDHDGLTDGQEKLFNTNPLDPTSPGIAVQYDSSFHTLKYFSASDPAYLKMVQGGNQILLTEGAVVRRGNTIKIAAINSLSANLTVTGTGMTPITPVRDPARGGWIVTIPADGTVGAYTATITNGAWTKSIPIYVIFELPTNMSQAQINAFLYDDNPASTRDQVAVWWRSVDWKYYNNDSLTLDPNYCVDSTLGPCSNWQYHTMSGYAQAFWTEQYTKKVLVNFTIPATQGTSNVIDATTAIATRADQAVYVNFGGVKNSFSSATTYFYGEDPAHPGTFGYHMAGGACETQAGVFTAMLRSAGIASRPFALDYNKTDGHGESGNFGPFEYDHAVMMWANGVWYADRTFNGSEPVAYAPTPSWSNGPLLPPSLLSEWRTKFHYQDNFADLIQSANEGWDFQNHSAGGGMVNTEWTGNDVPGAEFVYQNRDYKWDSKNPLKIQQSPYVDILACQLWKGDNWAPSEWLNPVVSNPAGRSAVRTYYLPLGIPDPANPTENWPFNPQPTSCSDSTNPSACAAFMLTWQAACAALPGQTFAAAQSSSMMPVQIKRAALDSTIQLGKISADTGLDLNGDGRFDQLNVQFELSSSVAGKYQLGGWLRVGDKQIRAQTSQVNLVAGTQSLQVSFDGLTIGDQKVNGPYQVEALWVAPADQAVSELALPEEMTAYQAYTYSSQAYPASAFTVQAASVSGNYSYSGTDANKNGLFDSLTISVPLSIATPGNFKLEGDLYDGTGGFIGHSVWTGSDASATLKFAITGKVLPYSLSHLNLMDDKGNGLASFYAPVFTITDLNGKVDLGNVVMGNKSTGVSTQSITPSNAFTVTPVDFDANGRYDQLVIGTTVNVATQANYWMEGLLVDDQNMLVAWSTSTPQALIVGNNQPLQMTFDGRQLFDHLPLTTGQKFTLVAVKIFSGSLGQAVLEADLPVANFNTPTYMRSNFEPSDAGIAVFQDDMESGAAKWSISGSSQWSESTSLWHSWSHAWTANGSASNSGLLSFAAPLDLTNYASPVLKFNTAYQILDGQTIKVEASTDGNTWTALKTFTGPAMTDYWSPVVVDLGAYAKMANVSIRFNAQANAGLVWSIDDVFVIAGPVIKSASFTHTTPTRVGDSITFTADYVSTNKTVPVTYHWDFCGVSTTVSTPTIVHMFSVVRTCQVTLTVDNSYDSASAVPQTISVTPGTLHLYMPVLNK